MNLKYAIKSIIRDFARKPATNIINFAGLSISLTLVIILSAYCYSELTTDRYNKNSEDIYLYRPSDDGIYTPGILKESVDLNVSGVKASLRLTGTWNAPVFQTENGEPIISDLVFADENFFDFFSYNVIDGDLRTALKEPMTVVITKGLAERLFGQETSVGKIIKINNSNDLTVKAVISRTEGSSCLSFSALSSIATQKIIQGESGEYTNWGWCDFQTFLMLQKGSDPESALKTVQGLIPADFHDMYAKANLVPLRKLYFTRFTMFGDSYLLSGDRKKVMIMLMVAILVLIVALINFINISSSKWLERTRKTGILKILGVTRTAILIQIISEVVIFFFISLLVAADLVRVLTPFIHRYTGINYYQSVIFSPEYILIALTVIILLSLLISIIPALKISSSRAVDNLKNTIRQNKSKYSLTGSLVTFQFTVAIVLISFTLLVQKQVRYGSNNPGILKNNVVGLQITPQLEEKKEVLKEMLLSLPAVNEITFTQYYPGKTLSQWGAVLSLKGEKKEIDFDTFSADAGFFKILGMQTVKGRLYSDDITTDKGKVLVNEAFLQRYECSDPVGGVIIIGNRTFEIVGVLKDFHYRSFSQPIAPLVIRNDGYASVCLVDIMNVNASQLYYTVGAIKKATEELSPSFPVEVTFLDQAITRMYESEEYFRHSFTLFAGCAIIISCLGILAMSVFACQSRVKEIGIRKVNGAKIAEILGMLNKDLTRWVAVAFAIACPVAWYFMHDWLKGYAYKTIISWWIFVLAGAIALGIAVLTVSWQSWRAATRNPVDALRYE
jgi:putative ABC transport system permease protein